MAEGATRRTQRRPQRAEFSSFVDALINAEMQRENVPGAAFVFVQDGRVVHLKGYGFADVARNVRVDPELTVFRIGSITKAFTATAAVQLHDRGQLRMDVDVNRYLRRLQVPQTFARPITANHLLAHTSGLDEIRPGTQSPSAEQVLPLAEFLASRLVRIREPGELISYSTYGITLAGLLIEEVSNTAYEEYLRRELWRPLGMRRTNITIPSSMQSDVAVSYELHEGRNQPARWEWYHTTPASSMNSTAADMGRYMIALLNGGSLGSTRVLSRSATRQLLATHASGHPKIPGFTWGFYEDDYQGTRIVEHGGNVAGFSAHMALIPAHNAGFFIVNHHEQSNIRDSVKWSILERYFPGTLESPRQAASPPSQAQLSKFVGTFGWNTYCHSCKPAGAPFVTVRVESRQDGTLWFSGRRFIQVEPLLFIREDGGGRLAFRQDKKGNITHMFSGGFWVFERMTG